MHQHPATESDLRELFGDGFNEDYQAETQDRGGETPSPGARRQRGGDDQEPGLARYVRDAIVANSERNAATG